MQLLNKFTNALPVLFFIGAFRLALHLVGWVEMSEGRLIIGCWVAGLTLLLTLADLILTGRKRPWSPAEGRTYSSTTASTGGPMT